MCPCICHFHLLISLIKQAISGIDSRLFTPPLPPVLNSLLAWSTWRNAYHRPRHPWQQPSPAAGPQAPPQQACCQVSGLQWPTPGQQPCHMTNHTTPCLSALWYHGMRIWHLYNNWELSWRLLPISSETARHTAMKFGMQTRDDAELHLGQVFCR